MTGRTPRTAPPSDRADPIQIAHRLVELLPGQVPTAPQSLRLVRALRAPAQHIPPSDHASTTQHPTRKGHVRP